MAKNLGFFKGMACEQAQYAALSASVYVGLQVYSWNKARTSKTPMDGQTVAMEAGTAAAYVLVVNELCKNKRHDLAMALNASALSVFLYRQYSKSMPFIPIWNE